MKPMNLVCMLGFCLLALVACRMVVPVKETPAETAIVGVLDLGLGSGQGTKARLKDSPSSRGKYLVADGDADTNNNKIPDFAERCVGSLPRLGMLRIVLPQDLPLSEMKLSFAYSAAPEFIAVAEEMGKIYLRPDKGALRIWRRHDDGSATYVPTGQVFQGEALNRLGFSSTCRSVDLCVEAINCNFSQPEELITATLALPKATLAAAVKLPVMEIDMDVDSDDSRTLERSAKEDAMENDETRFNATVSLSTYSDINENGIPDFAEPAFVCYAYAVGLDAAGNVVAINKKSENYLPMIIQVPATLNRKTAKIKFSYSYSDPDKVIRPAKILGNYTPAPGIFRIWKDGEKESVAIDPQKEYSLAQLGFKADGTGKFFIEAAWIEETKEGVTLEKNVIIVAKLILPASSVEIKDACKVTPLGIETWTDSDNSGEIDYSWIEKILGRGRLSPKVAAMVEQYDQEIDDAKLSPEKRQEFEVARRQREAERMAGMQLSSRQRQKLMEKLLATKTLSEEAVQTIQTQEKLGEVIMGELLWKIFDDAYHKANENDRHLAVAKMALERLANDYANEAIWEKLEALVGLRSADVFKHKNSAELQKSLLQHYLRFRCGYDLDWGYAKLILDEKAIYTETERLTIYDALIDRYWDLRRRHNDRKSYLKDSVVHGLSSLIHRDDSWPRFASIDKILLDNADSYYRKSDQRRKTIMNWLKTHPDDWYLQHHFLLSLSEDIDRRVKQAEASFQFTPPPPRPKPDDFPLADEIWQELEKTTAIAESCLDSCLPLCWDDVFQAICKNPETAGREEKKIAMVVEERLRPLVQPRKHELLRQALQNLGAIMQKNGFDNQSLVILKPNLTWETSLLDLAWNSDQEHTQKYIELENHPQRYLLPVLMNKTEDIDHRLYKDSQRRNLETRLIGLAELQNIPYLVHKESAPVLAFVFKRLLLSQDPYLQLDRVHRLHFNLNRNELGLLFTETNILSALLLVPEESQLATIAECRDLVIALRQAAETKPDKQKIRFYDTLLQCLDRSGNCGSSSPKFDGRFPADYEVTAARPLHRIRTFAPWMAEKCAGYHQARFCFLLQDLDKRLQEEGSRQDSLRRLITGLKPFYLEKCGEAHNVPLTNPLQKITDDNYGYYYGE